ncbi:MAG TPA: 50S ribosomal protein L9 [Desulfobacterales bacterium]|nr:50S ribosomal protein L9 [Desulfobacterales bacterium]
MEIILKETIDTLGQIGDVVTVKPGYARNYLLPKGLAVPATKANLALLAQQKAAIEARRQKQQQEAEALAAKLADATVVIEQRVGDEDRLFGSVTAADIAGKLAELGIEIDKKQILLDEPIKTLGEKEVTVKTGYQQTATLVVKVEPLAAE